MEFDVSDECSLEVYGKDFDELYEKYEAEEVQTSDPRQRTLQQDRRCTDRNRNLYAF
jgi:hypothetical protein